MRLNQEVGCVFDTLAFLSAYSSEQVLKNLSSGLSDFYYDMKEYILHNNVAVPNYLYPFICPRNNTESFLQTLLFNQEYSKCSFKRLQSILDNKVYMQKCFTAYQIPNANEQTINYVLRIDDLEVVEKLVQSSANCTVDMMYFYIIVHFEKVIQSLSDLLQVVYIKMDEVRRSVLPGRCKEALEKESVYYKLKAITKASDASDFNFTVSLSLIKSEILSFRTDERNFVLLGCDFERILETEYKYCDITPFSFAQAISNPVKNEIFNTLLQQPPMSISELNTCLSHLSHKVLSYNIKEMLASGILIAEYKNKRTYKYRLDNDYLRVISRQLNV